MPKGRKRVIILGPTGSGKDTLLHYLAGILLQVAEDELCGVSIAPSAKDAIPGTIMGSGASKTRVPTYVTIGDVLFINCPGFFATEGPEKELLNAFIIQNVCKGDVKFLFTFKACEIDQNRCAAKLRHQFADLVNAFGGNLSNASGCVLTHMNIEGRCGYKEYIKKLGRYSAVWGGFTEGERSFCPAYDKGGDMIKDFLQNDRFAPFPLPAPDEKYYGNEHRQQILDMIERIPEYLHFTENNVRLHMSCTSTALAYEITRDIDMSIFTLIEQQISPALIRALDAIKLSCRGNIEALMEKLQGPKKLSEEFSGNADNIKISDIHEFLLNFLDREADFMKEFRGMMEWISFSKQIDPEYNFINTSLWVARLPIIVKNWVRNTIERVEAKRKLNAATRYAEAAKKLAEEAKKQADIERAKNAEILLRMQYQFFLIWMRTILIELQYELN